ncbi:MAG: hypothetical protein JXM73_06795 [Anaerolineae bacterium]|nr:hypothetical protein [Anaerolineae bacterium]
MAEMNNNSNKGLGLGCSPQVTLTVAALLILGALAVFFLTREPSAAEVARARLQIERAEALQPWNVALGIAWRAVAIGAGAVLFLALAAGVRHALHWLDTRARLIHPDPQTGQFPAVKVRRGEAIVDLNRLPDGKVMTGVVGGKVGLLLVLLLRYVLGKDVPELTEQPAVLVTPADTSPGQLQVTSQAQVVQALAAASRGSGAPAAVGAMLPSRPVAQTLPPLLLEERQPHEVQLLLEAGRREWDKGQVVDGLQPQAVVAE